MSKRLVLLRHGQSEWNLQNRFTGWYDCGLSERGEQEAKEAGRKLAEAGLLPDVVHVSVLRRAIDTATIALAEMQEVTIATTAAETVATQHWELKQDWRLNERHYGDLTGLNKDETRELHGKEQVHIWRRSYDVRPPEISPDNPWNPNDDPRYAEPPLTECLKDVMVRMLSCFEEVIVPEFQTEGKAGNRSDSTTVLVVAHGNSLRALVKHLDDIADEDIPKINIPTGVPIVYELGDDMLPAVAKNLEARYL